MANDETQSEDVAYAAPDVETPTNNEPQSENLAPKIDELPNMSLQFENVVPEFLNLGTSDAQSDSEPDIQMFEFLESHGQDNKIEEPASSPSRWLDDVAEREAFAIFLCMALNIDKPAEFLSEMHPKTMIDQAVWIRPVCPNKRVRCPAAINYVMSKIPGLYGLDRIDVKKYYTAARNFRDFLCTIVDIDRTTCRSDPGVIRRCKNSGCINDKFQKNDGSHTVLSCADCVHTEFEKMIGGPNSVLKNAFDGNACYRDLKCVLESEIRGENLPFAEIQRKELRAEKASTPSQKYPDSMLRSMHVHGRPTTRAEAKDELVKPIKLTPTSGPESTPNSGSDAPQLEPELKHLANVFGQCI